MELNEHTIDRVVRVALGLALVALVFFGPKVVWYGVAGLVLIATGAIGFCPLYRMIGVRTRGART